MEAILLNRLATFATNIKEHQVKASELCACRPWGKDQLEQAAIIASKLQSILGRFQSDLYQYFNLSKDPNADEISNVTAIQLDGDEVLAELNARIQADKDTRQVKSDPTTNRSKLPELDLISFHGDVLEWTQFWDQFSSNIDQRNIRDVDKLLYLKASLKGEAKTIIDGLETTNDNYKIAIDTLRERYGNRVQIVDAHYSSLYKIKKATKPEDCRKTLDELERHLRVLQSLGEDTNQNHLRFLFMEKFPEDIIYEMKLKLKIESIEEIRKQLNAIISAKEDAKRISVETKDMETTFTTETLHIRDKFVKKSNDSRIKHRVINMREKPNKFRKNTSTFSNTFTPKKRTYKANSESNNAQASEKRRKLECIFCQENHYNDACTKFKTLAERKDKIPNRCYICLKIGHRQNECRITHICYHCGERNQHNRALCPKKLLQATETSSSQDSCA
ncbi:uncharacterized protein LOC134668668 [Cydia fagiglandana]|uniref:uncharacterized protein LOC134668668 n=1 Tax=Cydia fagiglandana TaxID=1458189 RepID=UPI002FEDE6C3